MTRPVNATVRAGTGLKDMPLEAGNRASWEAKELIIRWTAFDSSATPSRPAPKNMMAIDCASVDDSVARKDKEQRTICSSS